MRNSITIAAIAAAVAALLIGGWFVFSPRGSTAASSPGAVPTTLLAWPSSGSPSSPYPTIPSAQVRQAAEEDYPPADMRTGHNGRQLLIPVTDLECLGEEVRLLGEHPDRVEVEIRMFGKPPPPGATLEPDGSYSCSSFTYSGLDRGPHAAVDLASPLGSRTVVIHRKSV